MSSTLVEHLPTMHKALGLIPSTKTNKQTQNESGIPNEALNCHLPKAS
jgi:hypothetical protein